MATKITELKPFYNPTPADFIQEQLDARGWTQEDLAHVLNYSLPTINKLLKNKTSITIDVASALADAFKQTPQYWLNLDNLYRLNLRKETQMDSEVALRAKIYETIQVNEMAKRKWIDKKNLVASVTQFFRCKNIDEIFDRGIGELAYKKSEAFEHRFDSNAASCWFQMAKNTSETIKVPQFDSHKLVELAHKLHSYTVENDVKGFLNALNACGVRFFVLSHLPKTYIDGAAFYLGNVPTIVYTARYKRLDNFWFVIAHEIGHIIREHLNAKNWFIIDSDNSVSNQQELEANQEAARMLKHKEILDIFGKLDYLPSTQIVEAAKHLSVHPCIIVGALSRIKETYYKRFQEFNEDIFSLIPDVYQIEKYL
jgi:HTH-type transcriptional regulator / antitoxin HigA